eukprot:SAG31_NODE_32844_length_351_cov_0.607143_1_plen_20_part_10
MARHWSRFVRHFVPGEPVLE